MHRNALLAALLSLASALPAVAQPAFEVSTGVHSAYVWRGLTVVNRPVVQPEVSLTLPSRLGELGVGVWTNVEPAAYDGEHDISEVEGQGPDLTEATYWVDYSRELGSLGFSLGAEYWTYPNAVGVTSADNTAELYAELRAGLPLAPRVRVAADIDEIGGQYVEAGVSHAVPLLGAALSLDASAGYSRGQAGEHGYYAADGFTHVDLGVSTNFALGPISLSPALRLQRNLDEHTRLITPTREREYLAWFGATLAWSPGGEHE